MSKKIDKKLLATLKKKPAEKRDKLMEALRGKYSEEELKTLVKSGSFRVLPGAQKVPIVNFEGETVKFGFITDLHLGSIFASPEMVIKAFDIFKKEGCNFIACSGDVTEGMSNRNGHVFECSHYGYDRQKVHAIDVLSAWGRDFFVISGNHDRWYIKNSGAEMVKDISDNIEHFHYLGHDNGTISLQGKASMMLWHGEDGSSYATSYRIQKLIESLTGGEKPNVLLAGHTHKQGYFFERHVHAISGGALSRQSSWMKGKRLANHFGFHIIELTLNDSGIARCKVEWLPCYS